MNIQKESNAYLATLVQQEAITQDEFKDIAYKPEINAFHSKYLSSHYVDNVNWGWNAWQAAKADVVPEWISVEDKKPEGACLVKLKERTLHNIMHTALFESEFQIIGGHFAWDMPKVTHWMPLPQEPSHDQ